MAEAEGLGVVDESVAAAASHLLAYVGKPTRKGIRVGVAVILFNEVRIYGQTCELTLRLVEHYVGIVVRKEIVEVGDDGRHTRVCKADFWGGRTAALHLLKKSGQLPLKSLRVGAEIRSAHKPGMVFRPRNLVLPPGEVVKMLKKTTNLVKTLFGALSILYAYAEPPTEPFDLLFQCFPVSRIRKCEMENGNSLLRQNLRQNAGVGAISAGDGNQKVRFKSAANGVYPLNPCAEGFGEAADFGFLHKRHRVVSIDEKVV